MDIVTKILSRCKRNETTGCLEWQGRRLQGKRYGMIDVVEDGKRKIKYVHRAVWESSNGPIPSGMCVCHHCDNPCCVELAHLFLGTQKDNLADMVAKRRHASLHRNYLPSGESHWSAKLTAEQVKEIRSRYVPGVMSMPMLAKLYGVTAALISLIVHRAIWKDV